MHPGKHSYFGRTRGIEAKGTLCISRIYWTSLFTLKAVKTAVTVVLHEYKQVEW